MVIGRCQEILTAEIKEKIALFADMDKKAVITGLDVDNIYKIPLIKILKMELISFLISGYVQTIGTLTMNL